MNSFHILGYVHDNAVSSIHIDSVWNSLEAAQQAVARLPKFTKLSTYELRSCINRDVVHSYRASVKSTVVRSCPRVGEKNETGVDRLIRTVRAIEKAGFPIVWGTNPDELNKCANPASAEQLKAALGL